MRPRRFFVTSSWEAWTVEAFPATTAEYQKPHTASARTRTPDWAVALWRKSTPVIRTQLTLLSRG